MEQLKKAPSNDEAKWSNSKYENSEREFEGVQSVQNVQPITVFPVEAFPKFYQDLMNEYRDKLGFQRSYTAATILTVISVCIGNSFKVKVREGWDVKPILYMALFGNSAMKKTPVINKFLAPFYHLEEQYQNQYNLMLSDWELLEEKTPKPKRKHIIINDATPESIIDIHSKNEKSLLYHNDEIMAMVKRFSQYRNGPDQEFWLSAHDNAAVKITRKTQDTIYFNNPFISLIGGIQPVMLNEFGRDNRSNNGFLFRMLFVIPEDLKADTWCENEIDPELKRQYDQYIELINEAFNKSFLIDKESIEIEFSSAAKEIFKIWYNKNVQRMNDCRDDNLVSIYRKLESYFIRLALILEVLYSNGKNLEFINTSATTGAIHLIEYFRNTAEFIYQKVKDEGFDNETDRKIYSDLPQTTTTQEIIAISAVYDVPENTVKKRLIPRYLKRGMLNRESFGKYFKTIGEAVHNVHDVHYDGFNKSINKPVNGVSKHDYQARALYGKLSFKDCNEYQQKTIVAELGEPYNK